MKYNNIIKEYLKTLNDEELKSLNSRLTQRLGGDVGEATEMMQRHPEMDRCLLLAKTADDFFDIIDQVDELAQQEAKRRST